MKRDAKRQAEQPPHTAEPLAPPVVPSEMLRYGGRVRAARKARLHEQAVRIGRLVHLPIHGRVGRLYRASEYARLHPEVTWRSDFESESSVPQPGRRRRSTP